MGHLSREKIASEHRLRQRMQSYPALLIGQLAVWKDQQGNRIGTFICDYCLCKAIQLSEKVLGCRFLVVDAVKEAVKFYDGYGFVLAPKQDKEKQKLMFLDITKGKP